MKYKDLQDEDLSENPVLVLKCEHVFTMATLDGMFEIGEVYIKSTTGEG